MKCFNPKVLGGLAFTALAVFLFSPGAFSAVLPLLIMAACPLSMVLMMRAMSGGQCSSRAIDAEHQTDATGAGSSMSAAEAEIARLRAEVDQLKAEQAARSEADPAMDTRSGDNRT